MTSTPKYVLDTTILIENIKEKRSVVIDRLNKNGIARRYHLYHCLIEFRLGLLYTWVKYYLEILATQDIKAAQNKMGNINNYKPRQGTNYITLDGLLTELNSSLEVGNINSYLAQVAECISYAQSSIQLLSEKIIGSNGEHVVLIPEFLTVDDYEEFVKKCEVQYVVDVKHIILTRRRRFEEVIAYIQSLDLSGENSKKAKRIVDLMEKALTNPSCVNMKSKNRSYGDIIIAMNTPKSYNLVSSDYSFTLLCGGLGQSHTNFGDLQL
jgi:hypothetical protein